MKTILFVFVCAYQGTISKVIDMLESMLEKSKTDGEADHEQFAKDICSCNTDKEEQEGLIKENSETITLENAKIEKLLGDTGKLSEEIAQLTQDLADNQQTQEDAKNIRDKEQEDFEAKETDMKAAIEQMKQAVETLAAIGADQTSGGDDADSARFLGNNALVSMRKQLQRHMQEAAKYLPSKQRSLLEAPFSGTYTSQSGEIVGILKSMKDTFQQDLASAVTTNEKQAAGFEKFTVTMAEQKATMEEAKSSKETQMAENKTALSTSKEDLAAAKDTLEAAEKFLGERNESCTEMRKEYDLRSSTRAQEEAAISEAVAILNSDTAFDNKKLQNTETAFVQLRAVRAHSVSVRVGRVMQMMDTDPFALVVKEIKKMLDVIAEEEKTDDQKKTWCDTEFEQHTSNLDHNSSETTSQEEAHSSAQEAIDSATGDLTTAQTDLKDLRDARNTMVTDRRSANVTYQKDIADLQEAEKILGQALRRLKQFYERETEHDGKDYAQQEGGEVLTLLENIQTDIQTQETEAHTAEESSQQAFETDMQSKKEEEAALGEQIQTHQTTIAEQEKARFGANKQLNLLSKSLVDLNAYKKSIDPGCNFIIDNIDFRKTQRASEKGQLEECLTKVQERQAAHTA